MTDSLLWKSFDTKTSMFSLTIGDKTLDDEDIISITITRGGQMYGCMPSIMEVELVGGHFFNRNEAVSLRLKTAAAEKVTVNPEEITDRFIGRLAVVEMEDTGDGLQWFTTITCTSYSALLRQSPVTISISHREAISDVVAEAIAAPRLAGKAVLYPLASSAILDSGRVWTGTTDAIHKTFKEVLSDYVEPLKTLLQDRRDGTIRFMTLALRQAVLFSQIHKSAPLRSSVLSPVIWKQGNELRSNNLRFLWRESDGTITTRNFYASTSMDALIAEVEPGTDNDMSDLLVIEETRELIRLAEDGAVNYVTRGYESIIIPTLDLLTHGSDYQRYVVFEMLRLEHGDAVYFGGDWSWQTYPMIATGIKETITPDTWDFELTLNHPRAVLGIFDLPAYPPQVWDQATQTWDESPYIWDEV